MAFSILARMLPVPGHPLHILLDDFDLADASTVDLLENLLLSSTSRGEESGVVVVSFKSDSALPGTRLSQFLETAAACKVAHFKSIFLGNPNQRQIHQLVGEMLAKPIEAPAVCALSDAFYSRSPCVLNVVRAVLHLKLVEVIRFDHSLFEWVVDVGRIGSSLPSMDGGIDINMLHLCDNTMKILGAAVVCGQRFTIGDITAITKQTRDCVQQCLCDVIRENLIAHVTGDSFVFIHDKVQEVLLSKFSAEDIA